MKVGDIVKWYGNDHYYICVVMEINNDTVFVQDESQEQYEVPISEVKLATVEEMAEELRLIYGFYH